MQNVFYKRHLIEKCHSHALGRRLDGKLRTFMIGYSPATIQTSRVVMVRVVLLLALAAYRRKQRDSILGPKQTCQFLPKSSTEQIGSAVIKCYYTLVLIRRPIVLNCLTVDTFTFVTGTEYLILLFYPTPTIFYNKKRNFIFICCLLLISLVGVGVKDIAGGAVGLVFDPLAGQVGHCSPTARLQS